MEKNKQIPIIRAFGLTDVGSKRKSNEDAFLINKKYGLFIIADGMGGHGGGEIASRLAVTKIDEYLSSVLKPLNHITSDEDTLKPTEDFPETGDEEFFRRSVIFANKAIFDENPRLEKHLADDVINAKKLDAETIKKRSKMGTTLIAGLVRGNIIHVINVGDSRLYRIRNNSLQLVTVDQSVLEERIQSGEITEERAKFEPRNKITGYLGINEDIEIQLNTLTARVGDRYIMCSDGLTDGLLDKNNFELAEKIMKGKDIKTACAQLIPLAIKGGSKDNITVVIFDIIDLGIKPPGREWKEESYDDDETLLPGWEDMEE